MKVEVLFAGLLYAGGIAALPKAKVPRVNPSQTPGIPTPAEPTGSEPEPTTTEDPEPEPTTTKDSEPTECPLLPFENTEEAASTWDESGADDYLSEYLEEHGVEGWADKILSDSIAGGSPGGQTFDCETIGSGSCSLPEDRAQDTYDPCEALYIQTSIANLNIAFDSILTEIDGDALEALGSTTKDVEEIFGDSGTDGIWPILIGIFVGAAAAAGPVWQVGAPMTAVVGALNVAAGIEAASGEEDVGDSLEEAVTNFYGGFRETLKNTASALLAGNFDDLGDLADGPGAFIYDAFSDGKLLVVEDRKNAVNDFVENFKKFLNDMLIFQCLASNDWEVYVYDIDEDQCEDTTDGTGYWVSIGDTEGCAAVVAPRPNDDPVHGTSDIAMMDDDQLSDLEDWNVDLKAAIESIVECDGGEYEYDGLPEIKAGDYPACILPMKLVTGFEPASDCHNGWGWCNG